MGGLKVQVEGVRGDHDLASGAYGGVIVLEEKTMSIKYFLPCIKVPMRLCRAPSYSAPKLQMGAPMADDTARAATVHEALAIKQSFHAQFAPLLFFFLRTQWRIDAP